MRYEVGYNRRIFGIAGLEWHCTHTTDDPDDARRHLQVLYALGHADATIIDTTNMTESQ